MEMTSKVREQLDEIRESGKYNMFDVKGVQYEAHQLGYHDTVVYLEENKDEYVKFVMHGDKSE